MLLQHQNGRLGPDDLARAVWGLATLAWRPGTKDLNSLAISAARAACQLAAPELVQLLEAFSRWGTLGEHSSTGESLLTALKRRSGDLTSSELISVLRALQHLDIWPSSDLLHLLRSRALTAGPFDPQGAHEVLQSLDALLERSTPSKRQDPRVLHDISTEYAMAASQANHLTASLLTSKPELTRLLAPPTQEDPRLLQLKSQRAMIYTP